MRVPRDSVDFVRAVPVEEPDVAEHERRKRLAAAREVSALVGHPGWRHVDEYLRHRREVLVARHMARTEPPDVSVHDVRRDWFGRVGRVTVVSVDADRNRHGVQELDAFAGWLQQQLDLARTGDDHGAT